MTVTVLKTYIKKLKPSTIKYRNFDNFDILSFRKEMETSLQVDNDENMNYENFKNKFMQILNNHVPLKEKKIRGNNAPFMNKALSKAFMKRSRLKNNYNKNQTEENKSLYKSQRNFCVKLVRKEKKKYYNNLDLNIFKDNKTFWQRVKPLFSDKQTNSKKEMTLIENGEIITDEHLVAEKLNNFFTDVIENLDIEPFLATVTNEDNDIDSIDFIVKKYNNHPSILKIKGHVTNNKSFSFKTISENEILKLIKNLDIHKACVEDDIPTKSLIENSDIISNYIANFYNDSIKNQFFPESLKFANLIPIYKKEDRTNKENYRPVSLLPIISKIFERDMYNQILNHINSYLSPYLFGFRKGYSTELCLSVMIEQWKKALDNKQCVGAVLTDLSKAFDCINHELLIAKLEAYGFQNSSLNFIYNYLSKRYQRTKVKNAYSSWREIKSGVPQGSILGPLLFNIFINDIFLFVEKSKIANYADDNTPYAIETNIESLLQTLEEETSIILKWFQDNEMKSNNDKCHLLIINHEHNIINIGEDEISGENQVKLLGITVDNKLNFNEHVNKLCKKASQKLHALARIAKYMDTNKLKILMKTFIESQFNYCPLLWMFHSRTLNNKINNLHERALRIAHKNDKLTFKELLNIDNSYTIHQRNLQKLATEMYKIKNNISSSLMNELFPLNKNTYDLRNKRCWETSNVRTVSYGTETLLFRGQKIWQIIPDTIKESNSLNEFKQKVRHWNPIGCTCRLCLNYVNNLGFI